MAADRVLVERVLDQFAGKEILEKRMFGGWGAMWRGHLLVGVLASDLVARVGTEATVEVLSAPGVRPFDFSGRPMRGWVYVSGEVLTDDEALARWLGRCEAIVGALPPK
jgi:hypothetical protein